MDPSVIALVLAGAQQVSCQRHIVTLSERELVNHVPNITTGGSLLRLSRRMTFGFPEQSRQRESKSLGRGRGDLEEEGETTKHGGGWKLDLLCSSETDGRGHGGVGGFSSSLSSRLSPPSLTAYLGQIYVLAIGSVFFPASLLTPARRDTERRAHHRLGSCL